MSEQQHQMTFSQNRSAHFLAVDEEAKELNRKTREVAYRQYTGDGFLVSVNDCFTCQNKKIFHALRIVGAKIGETQ